MKMQEKCPTVKVRSL